MSGTSAVLSSNVKETPKYQFRSRREEKETIDSKIKSNVFYQVVFDPSLSPEAKVERVAEIFESTTKDADRAKVKEFDDFKEYMQNVAEEMSKQRISMTDTETFSSLQQTYRDFDTDLRNFVEAIEPLTKITDALYRLRDQGKTREALDQIQEDKEWEVSFNQKKASLEQQKTTLNLEIAVLKDENNILMQDKGFFGYGQIKPASMAKIKTNEELISSKEETIRQLEQNIADLNNEKSVRDENKENSEEIEQLRELLDITSEEHTERQKKLVEMALTFVKNGKERFGEVRMHLDKMREQIEGLGDNNQQMTQVYAILNDGIKKAEVKNETKRQSLMAVEKEESLIQKMARENSLRDLADYIGVLNTSTVDTMKTYGELATDSVKISNMEAATRKQSEAARAMHSRGIASVASQLSVVLTAVNQAATNESQSMGAQTLKEMAAITNSIAQKEAIRVASGRNEVNEELEAMLQELADYGAVQEEATEITKEAISRMLENLEEVERMAKDVEDKNKDFVSVEANAIAGKDGSPDKKEPQKEGAKSPFGF